MAFNLPFLSKTKKGESAGKAGVVAQDANKADNSTNAEPAKAGGPAAGITKARSNPPSVDRQAAAAETGSYRAYGAWRIALSWFCFCVFEYSGFEHQFTPDSNCRRCADAFATDR